MENNPYENPPGQSDSEFLQGANQFDGGQPDQRSKRRLTPPAIGLLVVGGLSVLLSLWGAVSAALFMVGIVEGAQIDPQQLEEMRQAFGEENEWVVQMIKDSNNLGQGPLGLIFNLVGLAFGGIVVFGSIKMLQQRSHTLAVAGAVVAMLPVGSCCCVGLPLGIWALVILLDQSVRQDFS
ncbi:hypothetical protein [Aureliella helgolandensis]|uniref:DUF4064 domain-containing protein n=1 Tax=Aureliella helgolandensis TaxID=2527968 RepID=A0A518G2G2_9BACT|nr:hypothetical protein [Aureliella helgolandensis]QDV22807.1 hypothetical protein Q31a_10980 [Aureliella helgolandensis]